MGTWRRAQRKKCKDQEVTKLLRSAQKELQQIGAATEELQGALRSYLGSPGVEKELSEVIELLESIPIVQRMTQIREEVEQRTKAKRTTSRSIQQR